MHNVTVLDRTAGLRVHRLKVFRGEWVDEVSHRDHRHAASADPHRLRVQGGPTSFGLAVPPGREDRPRCPITHHTQHTYRRVVLALRIPRPITASTARSVSEQPVRLQSPVSGVSRRLRIVKCCRAVSIAQDCLNSRRVGHVHTDGVVVVVRSSGVVLMLAVFAIR